MSIHPPTKPKKPPLTKGDIAVRAVVGVCVPLVLVIGYADARLWVTPTAAVTPTPTLAPTPTAAPRVSGVGTSPYPPSATTAPAATTVPHTTSAAAATATYAVGTSCAGHREGLREYGAAGRLLVCAAGTWSLVQPAGAPVTATTTTTTTTTTTPPAVIPPTSMPTPTPTDTTGQATETLQSVDTSPSRPYGL